MGKQLFNLHTHTARCGHGDGADIQYIQSAIDAGFKVLGFSEHLPFEEIRISGARMFIEQKAEYLSTMKKLKQEYKDQIDIKIGFEVEYFDDHLAYLKEVRKECDYMILGQHLKYIQPNNVYYDYNCYCSNDNLYTYIEQIESALQHNLITYIAHPDYFMQGRRVFSKECEEIAHRIGKASIHYDIPLEVNLNGFHYGKKTYEFSDRPGIFEERYPYPFKEFWQIISTYGCKIVYGYDAHSPIALLEKNRELLANKILKGIPLNFIDTIEIK